MPTGQQAHGRAQAAVRGAAGRRGVHGASAEADPSGRGAAELQLVKLLRDACCCKQCCLAVLRCSVICEERAVCGCS